MLLNIKHMENLMSDPGMPLSSWRKMLESVLPLWLLSIAVTAEGFPAPPISGELGIVLFVLALCLIIVLVGKRRMTVELASSSLFPLLLMPLFDEISTNYKSPFILVCALLLTFGIVGYQRIRATPWRVIFLLGAVVLTLWIAYHVTNGYWNMTGDLGYRECFPDAAGCAPLAGRALPWWMLVIKY